MNTMSYLLRILPLTLSVPLFLTLSLPALAQPELENRSTTLPESIIFQENFEPPGNGEPENTSGAGSRDGLRCSPDEQPIRPLMPKRNYGLTLQEHPPIFIYLPKTSAQQVVLVFRDETGESYERAFLPINARTGIVNFTLPNEKPPLEVGKNYQWSLAIVCGETVQPEDPTFKGWVQRVAQTPEVESELRQKSAIEQAAWYGANGYWYDMLLAMVQAKQTHPDDVNLTKLWEEVLESAGLSAIRL